MPIVRIPPDLSVPNTVAKTGLPSFSAAKNAGILAARESMGMRVRIKLSTETLIRWRSRTAYKRLHGAIHVSCPNAQQAELFVQAVQSFALSLSGKWLAPVPTDHKTCDGEQR